MKWLGAPLSKPSVGYMGIGWLDEHVGPGKPGEELRESVPATLSSLDLKWQVKMPGKNKN